MIMREGASGQDKQAIKILVVDDSNLDRRTLIKTLREHGLDYEIFEASNGEEALEILSRNYKDIRLIFLDWQMPKMDGMEFMKGVIKVPLTASIPIVMVTASGSEEAQSSARRVNPKLAGYVAKPYQSDYLINVISPCLKKIEENTN